MNDLGVIKQLILHLSGYDATLNLNAIFTTWFIMAMVVAFGYFASRKQSMVPSRLQVVGELIVSQIKGLVEDALGEEKAKQYTPLILALFVLLVLCNWIGVFPHMHEPTKDLNTPLSLGLLGFFIAHWAGIKTKGTKNYIKEYFQPFFIMMPLNLIGEIAKVVSISFRLFGNIMGGSIIILVVTHLTWGILLPPFLNFFFGLFVGAIQAFVFTMLTLVYISVQVN